MATERQIEANRRNAQQSTGPVTDLGKAVAKFNALKHGMTATTAVLPYEDAQSYAELRESLAAHYTPENPIEAMLVETVANNYWRLLRARRVETATMTLAIRGLKKRHELNLEPDETDDMALAAFFTNGEDTMLKMERYHSKIERSYFQAIETLRKVQKERLREEHLTTAQARQIGFVRQSAPNTVEPHRLSAVAWAESTSAPTQTSKMDARLLAIDADRVQLQTQE